MSGTGAGALRLPVFEDDLARIQMLLLAMGGEVEEAIEGAARALHERDEDLAAAVVAADLRIDAMEREVTRGVVDLLGRHVLAPDELRLAVSCMKVAGNLERLGDYAKNNARRVADLNRAPPVDGGGGVIRRASAAVRLMLKDALDAYARRDPELAADVRARDLDVDNLSGAAFRFLVTHMMDDPLKITAGLHLMFIARNLERMGDHATNIAEQVIYAVTGRLPDDERPKGPSTASQIAPIERPGEDA